MKKHIIWSNMNLGDPEEWDFEDKDEMMKLFKEEKFDAVCNLAAQAGVRYSLTNPDVYKYKRWITLFDVLHCAAVSSVNNKVF